MNFWIVLKVTLNRHNLLLILHLCFFRFVQGSEDNHIFLRIEYVKY